MSETDESGPFCRHWYEVGSCEKRCTRCGHGCERHEIHPTTACTDCECAEWGEPPEEQPRTYSVAEVLALHPDLFPKKR